MVLINNEGGLSEGGGGIGCIPNSPVVYIMLCMSAICFMTLEGLGWPHGNTWNVVLLDWSCKTSNICYQLLQIYNLWFIYLPYLCKFVKYFAGSAPQNFNLG